MTFIFTFTVPLEQACTTEGVHTEIDGYDISDVSAHGDDICITREDGETVLFAADRCARIDTDGLAACLDTEGVLHEFSFRKLVPIERDDLS